MRSAAAIRQLRLRRKLSLAQVAKTVGVSVGFLSAVERSQMKRVRRYSAQAGALLQNQYPGFF